MLTLVLAKPNQSCFLWLRAILSISGPCLTLLASRSLRLLTLRVLDHQSYPVRNQQVAEPFSPTPLVSARDPYHSTTHLRGFHCFDLNSLSMCEFHTFSIHTCTMLRCTVAGVVDPKVCKFSVSCLTTGNPSSFTIYS